MPIVNTESGRIRDTLAAMKVLTGADRGCGAYISRFQRVGGASHAVGPETPPLETSRSARMVTAIFWAVVVIREESPTKAALVSRAAFTIVSGGTSLPRSITW